MCANKWRRRRRVGVRMQRCGSQSRGCRASPNPALPLPVSWTLLPWPSAFQSYSSLGTSLARTALCGRRTSRVQILASAMRRQASRRMLTEQARARAAAARVLVAGRSLALPKLLAPRAGHCFGWHQDHVVEWLQYVCGPRTPDTRRICAHRERDKSEPSLYTAGQWA